MNATKIDSRTRWLIICSWLVISQLQGFGQIPSSTQFDTLMQAVVKCQQNDSMYIVSCIKVARYYDDKNSFDSMQAWLNKAATRLPIHQVSLLHFNFSAYQSIAYYYNGLLKMDLYESQKVLRIAQKMNDSILLTTGYNFMGLANANIGSYRKSIPYFFEGMKYAKQPPFNKKYIVTSKPHHLHGNLAEAYYHLKVLDSAKMHALESLTLASEIKSCRGKAVANNLLGLIYEDFSLYHEAIDYQSKAIEISRLCGEVDISIISHGAKASCLMKLHQIGACHRELDVGFHLMNETPNINYYFTKQFLTQAITIYKSLNHTTGLLKASELIIRNNERINGVNDDQISLIIQNSIEQEKRESALLLQQAAKERRLANIKFTLTLLALLGLILIFSVYRYYHKKYMLEVSIRNQLARDLHDDIGATLSSMYLYSDMANAMLEDKPAASKEMIQRITQQSKGLMLRIGDIIWSMKPASTIDNTFKIKVLQYVVELLTPANIQIDLKIADGIDLYLTNPLVRKNCLMIVKESFNNMAKYSKASRASVQFEQLNRHLILTIKDNGVGFDMSKVTSGNGLHHFKERMLEINGSCAIMSQPAEGTTITCTFNS